MFISFGKDLIKDVEFLYDLSEGVLSHFCKIAIENIQKGKLAQKKIKKAASKLDIEPEIVIKAIKALANIYLECSKLRLSPKNFLIALIDFEFEDDQKEILLQYYKLSVKDVRTYLDTIAPKFVRYYDLDWRLDVQVATKSLHKQLKPTFLLDIKTVGKDKEKKSLLLETDYATLKHVEEELEKAVNAAQSLHSKRLIQHLN